jgi:nucleotide-binding universal stress UspA family protein
MKTILIGIDFSPASVNALRYAAGMAQNDGARMVLVHAYQPAMLEPYLEYGMYNALRTQQEDMAMKHFETLKKSISAGARDRLTFEFRLELGNAAEVLLDLSKSLAPDLVVMGIKGANGSVLEKLLGSTTTAIIQRIEYPLLVIPEEARYEGLQRIAYATDYQEDDIRVIDEVLYFAKQNHAKLSCVHIRDEASLRESYQQELLKRTYQYDLAHQNIDFQTISHYDVVEGLKHYAAWQKTDLLVMLTHHRSRIGRLFRQSHCRSLALQTRLPLWIYPMNEPVNVG